MVLGVIALVGDHRRVRNGDAVQLGQVVGLTKLIKEEE